MTGGLPNVLAIRLPEAAQDAEVDEAGPVPIENIRSAWTVYATTARIFSNSATLRRLDNLVWRIWSNNTVHQQLSQSTFRRLVVRFSQHEQFELSTFELKRLPKQSPWNIVNGPAGTILSTAQPQSDSSNMQSQQSKDMQIHKLREQAHIPPLNPEQANQPAAALRPAAAGENKARAKRRNQSQTPMPPALQSSRASTSPHKSDLRPTALRSRRGSVATTASGRSRARPTFSRRKSSQGGTPQVTRSTAGTRAVGHPSTAIEGRAPNPALPGPRLDVSTGTTLPPPGFTASDRQGFQLPPSSWQNEVSESRESSKHCEGLPNSTTQLPEAEEVINRRTTATNQSCVQKIWKGRCTVRFELYEDNMPSEAVRDGTSTSRTTPSPPQVVTGQDLSDVVELPRRKSQLSLLLEADRHTSQIANRDSSPAVGHKQSVETSVKVRGETKPENKLLEMGRRDGVTKAGGVDPARRLPPRPTTSPHRDNESPSQPFFWG